MYIIYIDRERHIHTQIHIHIYMYIHNQFYSKTEKKFTNNKSKEVKNT